MTHMTLGSEMFADTRPVLLRDYLAAAAKIVETVAFEAAQEAPAAKINHLLELACAIEQAAETLK